jgi:hypothetical protein
MEFGSNALYHFFLRTGIYLPLGHLTGTPVNDLVPSLLGVRVHSVIEAGKKLSGQIRPVRLWKGQHLGHFFSSNAHAAKYRRCRMFWQVFMYFAARRGKLMLAVSDMMQRLQRDFLSE